MLTGARCNARTQAKMARLAIRIVSLSSVHVQPTSMKVDKPISHNQPATSHSTLISRRSHWLIGLLSGIPFLVGCGSKPAPKPAAAPPFAGTTLRVTCPEGKARLLLDRHGAAWARLQKVTLTFVDQDADLVVFAPAEMGRLIESGMVAPLPESVTNSDQWNGFGRVYYRHKLLLWGEKAYALPILGDGSFLIYRRDLFDEKKRLPPSTFAELMTVAQQFATERKRPVLPALPNDDEGLDRAFHSAAAAFAVKPVGENDVRRRESDAGSMATIFSFHRDVNNGEPRLTDSGFVTALAWLKSIQPLRANSGNLSDNLANDDAVMGIGTLSDLSALSPREHPGKYAIAPIPAGPSGERIPYIGPDGALIAVAKAAKNPTAALALAQHLSSPSVSLEVIHDPAFGCAPYRITHLSEHRDGWFNYGLQPSDNAAFLEALRVATEPRIVNAPLRLRMSDQSEYRRVLLDGVRKCLTEDTDPAAAMAAVDARWREMDRANPIDRKTMYLRSLNLKP
jgi:ABC-type glycerol-3-phosphate transport system substrate-binding protein